MNNNLRYLSPQEFTYFPTSLQKQPDLLDCFVTKGLNLFSNTESVSEISSYHASGLLYLSNYLIRKDGPPLLTSGLTDCVLMQ